MCEDDIAVWVFPEPGAKAGSGDRTVVYNYQGHACVVGRL